MGVRCSISELAAEELAMLKAHPDMDCAPPNSGDRHFIDKGWHTLYELLRDKGAPWNLAITGDWRHPAWNVSFSDFLDPGADAYVGFVSTRLVQQVATVFAALSRSERERWYADKGLEDWGELDQLAEAYQRAAERGVALLILIA